MLHMQVGQMVGTAELDMFLQAYKITLHQFTQSF